MEASLSAKPISVHMRDCVIEEQITCGYFDGSLQKSKSKVDKTLHRQRTDDECKNDDDVNDCVSSSPSPDSLSKQINKHDAIVLVCCNCDIPDCIQCSVGRLRVGRRFPTRVISFISLTFLSYLAVRWILSVGQEKH